VKLAQSFERRLEQFVEGFFARTFRSGLQPVELGRKLARDMERTKTVAPKGVIVANHFVVALSPEDTERFSHFRDALRRELVAGLAEECNREGWQVLGPVQVEFVTDSALKLGRYRIECRIIEGAGGSAAAPIAPQPPQHSAPENAQAPHPQPRGPAVPRLITPAGDEVAIAPGGILLGRSQECDLRFDDSNVSRRHARIDPADTGVLLTDLASMNGTYVNGSRVESPTLLRDGDEISIGQHSVRFRA
jgi:hypothetical protein